MRENINKLFKSIPAFLKEGKEHFLLGLMQKHQHEFFPVHDKYGSNLVVFEQGMDGKWRKDFITIETSGASGYTVYLDWNKWKEPKEEEEGREEGKGKEAWEDSIVCSIPHLGALFDLLRLLYPDKEAKFSSRAEHKPANSIDPYTIAP